MCLWFDAWCCFGPGPGDDDDYCRSPRHHAIPGKGSAPPPRHHHHHPPPAPLQRNSHYPYDQQGVVAHHANGHRAHDHHQLPVAAAADEEEYRKASNDARRGGGHAGGAATKGGHGHAAGAAYVYSGPQGTVKQAARSAMIVGPDGEQRREGAHHFYPAHREGTAGHRYPTTPPSIADYGRF